MRILHVSDIHASTREALDQDILVAALLTDAEKYAPFDLAIVTGDISFSGQSDEYNLAEELLLTPLRERLGLTPATIVLVPGNHDVDRERIKQVVHQGLLSVRDTASLNRILDDPEQLQMATASMEAWKTFHGGFYTSTSETLQAVSPMGFAHRFEIEGRSVGVAALDSAWRSASDSDRGQLLIGDRQVHAALEAIDDADIRVVAFHHPLEWLADFDADNCRRELQRRGVYLLTGHDHNTDTWRLHTWSGTVVWSRAGCLYQGRPYEQGYTILEIPTSGTQATLHLRKWAEQRGEFVANVDLIDDGRFVCDIPIRAGAALVHLPAPSDIFHALDSLAWEMSLTPQSRDGIDEHPPQVLVAPRFYPAPFQELAAAVIQTGQDKRQMPQSDGLETTLQHRVVLVSGDPQSGVSDALVWLLRHRHDVDDNRLPVYAEYRPRPGKDPVEGFIRQGAGQLGFELGPKDPLPPLVVALDDVVAAPKPLQRLCEHVAAHPESNYILGCHSADRDAVASALQDQGLEVETLYLGPFGRPEVRDLVKRVAGHAGEDLLSTIMQVAFSADLPRNPFVLSALIVVLVDDPSAESLNESTILDSYTRLLLGMADVSDPEGLGMDVRRRENLLGVLARHLYEAGEVSIPRTDAERFILDFFERKGWERSLSAGNILDDLIRRRVLVVDTDGVRFRHRVLQYLFVAKQVLEDDDFRAEIFEDPIVHFDAVKHAVAIKRSDVEMLRRVGEDATQVIRDVTETVSVDLFDNLQDPDQLAGNPDLDRLASQLTLYPSFSEMERRRDEMYEEMEVQAAANGTPRAQRSKPKEGTDLVTAVGLLSEVIARSELVDDVELKTELTREAIRGWALALVVMAVREGQTNLLHEIFQSISEPEDPDSVKEVEKFNRWLNQFIGTIMTIVVVGRAGAVLGIPQLDGPVRALLDDADFMASAAHALLTTRLVIDYRQDGWVDRLRSLRDAHGKHPIVGEVIWAWAMVSYLRRDLDPADESALVSFLADITAEGTHAGGPNVVQKRAAARSRALQQLRDKRRAFLQGTERGYGDVASDIETVRK